MNVVPDDAKIAELTITKLRQFPNRLAIAQVRADLEEDVSDEHAMP